MNLTDPSMEAAYDWIKRSFEARKDMVPILTWRVGTSELYAMYKKWVGRTKFDTITISDIWGIIQIEWPFVEIVGPRGNRVYAGMKKREP